MTTVVLLLIYILIREVMFFIERRDLYSRLNFIPEDKNPPRAIDNKFKKAADKQLK